MTLSNLPEDGSEGHGIATQDVVATRDETAEKVNDNLPVGWDKTSMMNVELYTRPLSTLKELKNQ